jgi:AcrR family transcriptional regulator
VPQVRKTPARRTADHRTRIGRERRARTRQRIIEAALGVIAEWGPDTPVIEDFILAAGIARGTFYNHFKTTEELLTATSNWLEDDVIHNIESVIGGFDDPVRRVATGMRLWLRLSRQDPVFCAFVVRSRFRGAAVERTLALDLNAGLRSGRLAAPSIELARDLVVGTIREAQARMMDARVPRTYPDDIARIILRALRVEERQIDALLAVPVPAVERGSGAGGAPSTAPSSRA